MSYVTDLVTIMLICTPMYIALRVYFLQFKGNKAGDNTIKDGTKTSPSSGDASTLSRKQMLIREVVLGVFVLFMVGLFMFLSFGIYQSPKEMFYYALRRLQTKEGMNLIPFRTICNYFQHFGVINEHFVLNVLGNIFAFVPLGIGLPLLGKQYQNTLKMTALAVLLPVMVEFMQLFIGRQVDVDDIVLNASGIILGYLLYRILHRVFPKIDFLAH